METLKKLACFILAGFLFFAAVPAKAASNSDAIISALEAGIAVNGHLVHIPAGYINQATNYLAAHHLTDEQVAYIVGQINAAKAAIRDAGVTDLKQIDPGTKQEVLSAVQAAANEANLKLTVGSDKKVKIADSNGAIAFSDESPIKTTGANVNFAWVLVPSSLLISTLCLCVFAACKYRFFKRVD